MMKKIGKIFVAVSLGATCYYAGTYNERRYIIDHLEKVMPDLDRVMKIPLKPLIPIFQSVHAATAISPYVPSDSNITSGERVRQIMRYGYPSMDPETVRSYQDYVLSYDRRNRVAHWVFEHLTKDSVKANDAVDRSKCQFQEDKSVHPFFRAENSDYKKSGYDRGHLAAAGNHRKSQKHCDETFLLSNMAPQVGKGFNRDSWNRLEKHVRKLTRVYENVYCCTGPLYLPKKENDGKTYVKYEVIGANHVAVPTHFFKIIVGEAIDGRLEMEAYVLPNQVIPDETPLTNFQVPPESIERAAGLLFFNNLSRDKLAKVNGKPRL